RRHGALVRIEVVARPRLAHRPEIGADELQILGPGYEGESASVRRLQLGTVRAAAAEPDAARAPRHALQPLRHPLPPPRLREPGDAGGEQLVDAEPRHARRSVDPEPAQADPATVDHEGGADDRW